MLLHAILIALPARDGGFGVTVPELCGVVVLKIRLSCDRICL